jgi:hypothetical protein
MIRIVFLLFISLCPGHSIHAQSDTINAGQERNTPDYARWKKGFVVTLAGDTIKGKVRANDYFDLYYDCQRKVSFENKKGYTSHYTPGELASFCYYDDRDSVPQLITMLSISDPGGRGHIFSRLYCYGDCKVYGCVETAIRPVNTDMNVSIANTRSSILASEKKYIQLGHHEFYPLKMIGFKKNMKELFAMCPVIISRLDAKVYTYENWQAMVKDYNCGVCK